MREVLERGPKNIGWVLLELISVSKATYKMAEYYGTLREALDEPATLRSPDGIRGRRVGKQAYGVEEASL